MVMQGDVGLLPVAKIKRYLHQATGVAPQSQRLTFDGRDLADSASGSDFGLYNGAVIFLSMLPVAPTPTHLNVVQGYRSESAPRPIHIASSPSLRGGFGDEYLNAEIHRAREEERQKYQQEILQTEIQRARENERYCLAKEDFERRLQQMQSDVDGLRSRIRRLEEERDDALALAKEKEQLGQWITLHKISPFQHCMRVQNGNTTILSSLRFIRSLGLREWASPAP